MIANRTLDLQDYLGILRRRWWIIVIPALVFPVVAYLISLKMPNRYTSTTFVLVEQQKVPDTIVKSVVSEDVAQRLATMQEQILSRTRLQAIIEKYNLYSKELRKQPMEVVLEEMRKQVEVKPVKGDPSAGRTAGISGFYISFTANDAHIAQMVCGEISSMFIDQNLRAREQRATGTTDFLVGQIQEAKAKLDAQDAALAAFKSKYINQLPERDSTNLTMLTSLNTQLDAVTQAVTQSTQQKSYLQSLLAQQVAAWKSKQVEGAGDPDDLEKRRSALQAELLTLQTQYTADHPDVIRTKEALAQVDRKISEANERILAGKPSTRPTGVEPTEIVQMRLTIKQLEESIKSKTADQERLQGQIKNYQARMQLSPMVEEQYKKLTRDYQSAQTFYDDLLNKRQQSEMSTQLERDQQGEQFRVFDPPNLPEKPSWPNRLMIVGGAFVVGLALGGGVSGALEYGDKSMRSEKEIAACLRLPTLVSIPSFKDPAWDRKNDDVRTEAKVS